MSVPRLFSTFKSLQKLTNHPSKNLQRQKSSLLQKPQIQENLSQHTLTTLQKIWFPQNTKDLDLIKKTILKPGLDLKSELKGFTDPIYMARRQEIAQISNEFKACHSEIPRVKYNSQEQETWKVVYETLTSLHKKYACQEYLENFEELRKEYGLNSINLPQLQDVNEYLQKKSGFRVIPVAGMLTQRDFLSFLAFKIFTSTQYIRHHSEPFYSPEPDLVHEILGHIPMFANKEFAEFSQAIGLASLGASDEDIKKLGNCYLFSVEFGLIKQNDAFKIYGAGILSSAQEIENAIKSKTQKIHFQPTVAVDYDCPLSDLQNVYFYSESLAEAKLEMLKYVISIDKGFKTSFDEVNKSIIIT